MLLNLSPEMAATVLKSAPATRSLSSTMSSPAVNNCIIVFSLAENERKLTFVKKVNKYLSVLYSITNSVSPFCDYFLFKHMVRFESRSELLIRIRMDPYPQH